VDPPVCDAGNFSSDGKAGGGARACSQCAAGKFSLAAGSTACSECQAGTYSGTVGASNAATCLNCANGKYSATVGAFNASFCRSCPSHSTCPEGSVSLAACTCDVGYSGVGSACSACSQGTHKPVLGSSNCLPCQAGKYSATLGAGVCHDCAGSSWAVDTGSSACTECRPGYYFEPLLGPVEDPCAACPAGTYRAGTSRNLARACGPDGLQACATRQSSTSSNGAHYALDGNTDTNYTAGTCSHMAFSPADESPWWMVDLGQHQRVSAVKVWNRDDACCRPRINNFSVHLGDQNTSYSDNPACATNVSAPAAAAAAYMVGCLGAGRYLWIVVAGSGLPLSLPLSLCEVQVFEGCPRCHAGKYSSEVASASNSTCVDCPDNATSPAGSDASADCLCAAGFLGRPGGLCTACAAGKQKETVGEHNCTDCSAGTHKSTPGPGKCQACAAGKFARSSGSQSCTLCPSYAISREGSTDVTQCQCQPGYVGPSVGPCVVCGVGQYKSSNTCTTCPAGTSSREGSSKIANCTCRVGFSGFSDGAICEACTGATFKNVTGPGNCSRCPSNSVDAYASKECMCNPGYAGRGSQVCRMCPAGTFTSSAGALVCTSCAANSYASSAGVSACTQCPANSISPAGSIAASDCACAKGFSGPDGGPCVCAAGKLKDGACVQNSDVVNPGSAPPVPVMVYMSVLMPYTAEEFTNVKDQFTASFAKVAGVRTNDVSIVKVTEARRSLAGRRQQRGINVDLIVAVQEPNAVESVTSKLSLENMNKILQADGLKSITSITKAPTRAPSTTSVDSAEGQQSAANSLMLAIIIVPLVVAVLVAVACARVVCKRSNADKLQEKNNGTQEIASLTSGDGGSKIPGSPLNKGMQDFAPLTSPLSSPSVRSSNSPGFLCFDDDLAGAAYREAGVTVDVADVLDGSPTLSSKGCEPSFVFDVSSLRFTWAVQRPAEGEEEEDGDDKGSSAALEAGEEAVALTSAVISEKITAVYAENVRRITEAEDILASVRDFLSARHSSRFHTGETGHDGREEGKVNDD
jgi:hypothetical protein